MDEIEDLITALQNADHPDIQLVYLNNLIDRIILEVAIQEGLIDYHHGQNVDEIIDLGEIPDRHIEEYRAIEDSIIRGQSIPLIQSLPDFDDKENRINEIIEMRNNLDPLIESGIEFYRRAVL